MQAQTPKFSIPKPAREFKIAAEAPKPSSKRGLIRWALAGGSAIAALVIVVALLPTSVNIADARFGSVQTGQLSLGISGYGKLVPSEIVVISSDSGGRIAKIEKDVGAKVAAGDTIVTLSNPELQQKFREAEKNLAEKEVELAMLRSDALSKQGELQTALEDGRDDLKVAKLEIEGLRQLMESKIIARIDYEKAAVKLTSLQRQIRDLSAQVNQAKALNSSTENARETVLGALREDVARLRHDVSALAVKAPESGVLFELTEGVGVGSQILAGGTVARLSLDTDVAAELAVPASRAREVAIGHPVLIEVNGKQLEGSVQRINPQVMRDEITITISLAKSRALGLFAGQPVSGNIITRRFDNVTYTQRPAGAKDMSEGVVFEVNPISGKLVRRQVKYGVGDSKFIVIESGLKNGAKIILNDMAAYADKPTLRQGSGTKG